MAASVKSQMFTLPLCCDSVEWCRHATLNSIIAVGHYELTPKQVKVGGVTLFEHKSSDGLFEKVSFTETPPILDLKWHSFGGNPATNANEEKQQNNNEKPAVYLSAATSIGTIELFTLNETKKLRLKHKWLIPNIHKTDEQKDAASPICLSLDWNQTQNDLCITSLSDGSVAVLQFNLDQDKSSMISRMKCHSDQVWTACFDKYKHKVSYSGADDCLFCVHDYHNNQIIHKDNTTHQMGVCCITDSFVEEHLLLTGSYDEYLRLWDKRNLQKPIDALKFEDGVWRIKWNPNKKDANKILVATMRDHFNIVKVDKETKKLSRLYCYEQHHTNYSQTIQTKSDHEDQEELDILAYGCDWSTSDWIASCSFYDKQFHCWHYV